MSRRKGSRGRSGLGRSRDLGGGFRVGLRASYEQAFDFNGLWRLARTRDHALGFDMARRPRDRTGDRHFRERQLEGRDARLGSLASADRYDRLEVAQLRCAEWLLASCL